MYFLGIGGIGMSALARYYANMGVNVSGYDKTETTLTKLLQEENISIHYSSDIRLIPDNIDLVVYTPAIPADHPAFEVFKNQGVPMMKRSQAMAELVNDKFCIAIAGTHGKTTISSLVTHILKFAGKEVLAFVGGIMKNYERNLVFSFNPEFCIVEADEYDRSFLFLKPDIAVISAVDADHLDIYGNFENIAYAFSQFAEGIKSNGKLIVHHAIERDFSVKNISKYGVDCKSGLRAKNIRFDGGTYQFDIYNAGHCLTENVLFPFSGIHNVENALAAVQVALFAGIEISVIKEALSAFLGIHRRFEFRIKTSDLIYIDDYAHHPREIDALIKGVKGLYPGKKITGIFQPHLFSRTRDFADEFARSLEKLDNVIVLDIYPARELPIEGVNAEFLLRKIRHSNKYYGSRSELFQLIKDISPEILLTIGAGDIDTLVKPIKKLLLSMKEGKE